MESAGVLIGADRSQEWLIPWFFTKYSSCNTLPVAICDFGMSEECKTLCTAKLGMQLVTCPFKEISPFYSYKGKQIGNYDSQYHSLCLGAWFKKAQALTCSPFSVTLWLDLDCEVLKNVEPLFDYRSNDPFIAMVRDVNSSMLAYPLYNGGVILYDRRIDILKTLASEVISQKEFWGDDHLLSYLIAKSRQEVIELPFECNWRFCQGALADVYIFHWVGKWGKQWIREYGGIATYHVAFFDPRKE